MAKDQEFRIHRVQNLKKGASLAVTIAANYARELGIKAKDFLRIALVMNS